MTHTLQSLETRIPPPLLMLLFANLMLGLSELNALPLGRSAYTSGMAVLCLGAGFALVGLGLQSLRQAGTTVDPHHPERSRQLVQKGIYAVTRNPIYAGLLFFLLAWGFLLADVLALGSSYLFVMYMNRFQIGPEEALLEARFGNDYLLYCARVNRWFYSRTPNLLQ